MPKNVTVKVVVDVSFAKELSVTELLKWREGRVLSDAKVHFRIAPIPEGDLITAYYAEGMEQKLIDEVVRTMTLEVDHRIMNPCMGSA